MLATSAALTLLLGVAPAAPAATPEASAELAAVSPYFTGPRSSGSVEGPFGRADYVAYRDGWGAVVKARVRDTADDNDCVYVVATLIVTNGFDPDADVARVCGQGNRKTRTANLRGLWVGRDIRGVVIKVCRDKFGFDPCRTVVVDLAQPSRQRGTPSVAKTWALMDLPLDDFLRVKARAPGAWDWSDDGCSAPVEAPIVEAKWNELFHRACQRHDFGYRNFGGFGIKPTDPQRWRVDSKFLREMRAACVGNSEFKECRRAASGYFEGVRNFGARAFYGEGNVEVESIDRVVARLIQAWRLPDNDYRFNRLHPAVKDHYGSAQCEDVIRSFAGDPTFDIDIVTVSGPATWRWVFDGPEFEFDIPDVYTLDVEIFEQGELNVRPIHLGIVGRRLFWFTICGTPVGGNAASGGATGAPMR